MTWVPSMKDGAGDVKLSLRCHHIGPFRLRLLRHKLIPIAAGAQDRVSWSEDLEERNFMAVAVAVDRPHAPQQWLSVPSRRATVLPAMEVGEHVELWLSTRNVARERLVIGADASDQLDVTLRHELLSSSSSSSCTSSLPASSSPAAWNHEVAIGEEEEQWYWSAALDILRLGAIERHASLPLNWARKRSWGGALRPEAHTKTRRGRAIAVGDYQVEVKERLATLSTLGVLFRLEHEGSSTQPEEEEEDERNFNARERSISSSYPILDLNVLLRISRRKLEEQEEENAWDELLDNL
mmetsp:Transcript_47133/g.147510  ORF Transcript_47133/g.147510 Transcript_47133/m.147510 type:complete len:296 (-) Transcript_47133:417-1304(-)